MLTAGQRPELDQCLLLLGSELTHGPPCDVAMFGIYPGARCLAQRRQRQRETVLKSSGGTRSAPKGTPKFNNALEAYKWHKANQGK